MLEPSTYAGTPAKRQEKPVGKTVEQTPRLENHRKSAAQGNTGLFLPLAGRAQGREPGTPLSRKGGAQGEKQPKGEGLRRLR